jgi:hypothetical protein
LRGRSKWLCTVCPSFKRRMPTTDMRRFSATEQNYADPAENHSVGNRIRRGSLMKTWWNYHLGLNRNSICFFLMALCAMAPSTRVAPVQQQPPAEGTETVSAMTSVFNVKHYGAAGDGLRDDTKAIQEAIDACCGAGGGTVVLPPGTYRSGALRLRSCITLEVQTGAHLVGSPNLDDYYFEGQPVGLISARDSDNISIVGRGTIDGNGDVFADWQSMEPGGRAAAWRDGPVVMRQRPGNMLVFANCRNVLVRDVTISNAPFWTVHLDGCIEARLLNLRIRNNPLVPNNDGIHCTTSRNVQIRGCDIVAGDDAVAVTGINDHGPIIPGFIGYNQATENILVSDCILESRSAAIRVGYGHQDVRNCLFTNLVIRNSNRGLSVFTRNTGSVSGIVFSNILVETRLYDGPWWGNGEAIHLSTQQQFAGESAGPIREVAFRDIRASGPNGILVYGLEDTPIEDVRFEDVDLRLVQDPLSSARRRTVDIRPASDAELGLFERDTAAVLCRYIRGLEIRNTRIAWTGPAPLWDGEPVQVECFDRLRVDTLDTTETARFGVVALRDGTNAVVRNVGSPAVREGQVRAQDVTHLSIDGEQQP